MHDEMARIALQSTLVGTYHPWEHFSWVSNGHLHPAKMFPGTPDFYYSNYDCKVRPGGRVQQMAARPSFATQAATRATGLFWPGQKFLTRPK